jgi:hypothetical protein
LTSRVLDSNGRWNKIWAPWIKRLLDTVRVTASDVQTITETFDQLNAQWGITVNVNNRVTGAIKLDGSATASSFNILADHFVIVHPTADGTTITAFIAGLVDGVPTVGINGNLLVDGTILARSLDVDTLSAITADIGEVTAGVIRSSDSKFVIDLDNKTLTITT